jgi:hypothetical protein
MLNDKRLTVLKAAWSLHFSGDSLQLRDRVFENSGLLLAFP